MDKCCCFARKIRTYQKTQQPETDIEFNGELTPIVKVTPIYPKSALEQEEQGSLEISFKIGEDGKAINIKVIDSAEKALEVAYISALKKVLFPPIYSGKSITTIAHFKLNKQK